MFYIINGGGGSDIDAIINVTMNVTVSWIPVEVIVKEYLSESTAWEISGGEGKVTVVSLERLIPSEFIASTSNL